MDVIKEIVKSNPKAIDSEIDIPTIKHFDFKERWYIMETIELSGILKVRRLQEGEINNLSLQEIIELKESVEPFYDYRSEILKEFGIDQWSKVIVYPFLLTKIDKLSK